MDSNNVDETYECIECSMQATLLGPLLYYGAALVVLGATAWCLRRLLRSMDTANKQALRAILRSVWQPLRTLITYWQ
eukprot:COSAG01_NODE_70615_length_258_cov_0.647799_1_plen_76_part_01